MKKLKVLLVMLLSFIIINVNLVNTKAATNEEAAWKMYADGKDKLLRVAIIKETLFDILENYAENNNCNIYVGEAIYNYSHNEIMHLHDDNNEFFPSEPNSFNIFAKIKKYVSC